eukprot:s636_g30.t1
MSRRRGAFSAFEKTAQAGAAEDSSRSAGAAPSSASRAGIRRTAKSLSVDEAKKLLESLRVASGQSDFQKALTNLRSRGWGALKKREAVARLLGMAWKSSLKAAGFGIDLYGFPDMLAAVKTHHGDPSIRRLSEEVERHLRFQPGDLFGSKAGALKQTSSAAEAAAVSEVDVQVTVTHPTDRDSVVVTVPGSANMKQVKEALAAKLGRPEITRNGRMVIESQNGDLLPVPDGQRLGGKRQVLMVGISLSAPAASFANAAEQSGLQMAALLQAACEAARDSNPTEFVGDVKRFVTPLSYRMKRNKENSEDKESPSTGIEGDAASENDEVLTCCTSWRHLLVARSGTKLVIAEITPLELCRQSDAQRRASAKPKVAKPWQRWDQQFLWH